MNDAKQKTLDVMRQNLICVLSSVGPDGAPQSAVVGFAEDENGNLVIGTNTSSRKYRNIVSNPHVSVVIGWDERKTIQYQGLAHVAEAEELEKYKDLHTAKNPMSAKYKDDPGQGYIVIKPTWVRYTDASVFPWQVEEVKDMVI